MYKLSVRGAFGRLSCEEAVCCTRRGRRSLQPSRREAASRKASGSHAGQDAGTKHEGPEVETARSQQALEADR
jgi:hypothetical protein